MSQQSSEKKQNALGRFDSQEIALKTRSQLEAAGIPAEQITLQTNSFNPPVPIEATQTIPNAKSGAIVGGVLGGLIGLSISLIIAGFPQAGFAVFNNFDALNFFAPLIGGIIGAAAISLIAGLSGNSVLQPNPPVQNYEVAKRYSLAVEGTAEEITKAKQIMMQNEDRYTRSDS